MQIAILSFFHYFTHMFKKRESIFEVEEGKFLSPKFDKNGLIPVTTSDHKSGDVLMHGYMNEEALKQTIEKKEACYWSRSRKALWHKGKIIFGSTVYLEDLDTGEKINYKIVGRDEADLKQKLIFFQSPIGKGLIGKNKSDLVEINTPSGVKNFEIKDVKYI